MESMGIGWEKKFYPSLVDVVRPGELGVAKVVHHKVTEQERSHMSMRAAFGHPDEFTPDEIIVQLFIRGQLMMSTTRHERETNLDVMMNAKGRVLIAGLGLGMILPYMLRSHKVEHITVIELEDDVVDLVGPQIGQLDERRWSHKLSFGLGDINNWKPQRGQRFETIYFDIWPNVCEDNRPEITKLKRRFAKYLSGAGHWMGAWCEGRLRRRH